MIVGAVPDESPDIERELQMTDDVMHNIDACILQIEGKLLLNN